MKSMNEYREFLKDTIRKQTDFSKTDQAMKKPAPPIEKPHADDAFTIELPGPDDWKDIEDKGFLACTKNRRSHRKFSDEPLTIEELAFLCWTTQGIQMQLSEATAFRTVPSAGCRHAFETYLWIMNVKGFTPGCYRYLPMEHKLVKEFETDNMRDKVAEACNGQKFAGTASVVFFWSTIPYRMEWRYSYASHKVIAMDSGHVCQNLYLACEVINAGTCAIASYNQPVADSLLRIDGEEEFVIYISPVGKLP